MPKLQIRVVTADRQVKFVNLDGASRIPAEKGSVYSVVDQATGKPLEGIVLKKKGSTLFVEKDNQALVQIDNFYADNQQAAFEVTPVAEAQGISIETQLVTASTPEVGESNIVWQSATSSSEIVGWGTTGYVLGGALVVGSIAAAGGGGGGGDASSSSSGGGGASVAGFTISGSIVAGPVLNTNGLVITAYKADGTVLASGTVNADGTYSITVTENYTGTILVRVFDTNSNDDYLDEATGLGKDLSTDLRVVTTITGPGNVTLNINPLTELAVRELGLADGDNGSSETSLGSINASDIETANSNVATAMGLTGVDLVKDPVLPVINSDGTTNTAANDYGVVLAILSGMENAQGEETSHVLDYLVGELNGSSFSSVAEAELVAGASNAGESLPVGIVDSTVAATVGAAQSAISAYTGSNTAPTLGDYTNAGVLGVTSSNIDAINSSIAMLVDTATDSVAEVQAIAGAYAVVLAAAAGGTAPTLVQLQTLGLTGVTVDNLASVQAAIGVTDDSGSGVGSLTELQSVVTAGVTAATTASQSAISGYDGTGTAPTLSDYANTGITGVTSGSLAAINSALVGLGNTATDTPAEVQAVVDAYTVVLSAVDAGTAPSLVQLHILGLTGVTADNLAAVQAAIAATANDGSGVDTLSELQSVVTAGVAAATTASQSAISGYTGSNTAPTLSDYANTGITGVTSGNIAAINSALAGLGNTATDTPAEVQAVVDAYTVVLSAVDAGTAPTLVQLQTLGLTGVTADNLTAVQTAIGATDNSGSGVDTLAELQAVVTSGVAAASNAALGAISGYTGSNTAPTQVDYANAGITGVTSGNIAAINSALAGLDSAATDTLAEVQTVVDAYVAVLSAANAGTAPTLAQLQALGVTGVVAENLASVQAAIAATADDGTDVDTLGELQSVVTTATAAATSAAQSAISGYSGSNTAPTLSDYALAGVTGVTVSNLDAINSAIASLPSGSTDSTSEIQAVVSAYSVVLSAANAGAAPTLAQLQTLGVTGVTEDNLSAVQAAIAATDDSGSSVDTLSELQSVVSAGVTAATTASQSAISGYTGSNTAPTLSDYANTGITGVTSGNIAAINSALAGLGNTATDTPAEVQAVVDAYTVVLSAVDAGTAPTLVQLQTLGLTGVTADNLTAVQTAIGATDNSGSGVDTLAELQAVVTSGVAAASNAALGAISGYTGSNTAPTQVDYANVAITGVTSGNIAAINSALAGLDSAGTDTPAEVQTVVDAYVAVLSAANAGTAPTLAQLQALGVTGVVAENLASVQAAIAATADDGTGVDTLGELQSVVTTATAAATSAAQSAISGYSGSNTAPTLSDYALAGVTGVTVSNLDAINSAIASLPSGSTDSTSEIQAVVSAYSVVLSAANAGTAPTLAQLQTLGLTGLTVDNLAAVQAAIAATANDGSGVDTLSELQSVVTAGVAAATTASQSAISGYTGSNTAPTLSDYANTGITGVTSGNIAAINSALAGLGNTATDTPAEVQAVVDAYTTLFSVADGIDNNPTSPSQSDYVTLGVTGVDSAAKVSLLGDTLDTKAAADIDTVAKIQGLADIVSKVMLHAAGTLQTITQAEFETLGLTNLTPARVAVLLNSLAATANDGTGADTLTELQALVDVTAPTANLTAATDNYGSVTGNLNGGDYTDDTTLLLSGSCESGSTVNVYNGANLLGAAAVVGTGWTYTATVTNATTYQFNVKETDAAGNTSAASNNFEVIGDTSAPTASVQTATMDGTGNAVVQSTEIGTAYLVNSTVTVTNLASITGAAGNLFNSVSITAGGTNTNLSASGLIDGSYKVYTVDAVGNLSAPSSNTVTIQDMTAPTISSVSVPSADTYIVGETLSFTVNTDEVVNVTGTPRLALTVGASTVYANYVSGSGTSALVFSYTVQSGASDSDGIAVASLDLNGGTIRDGASNNLVTTLNSVGATAAVRVDGIAPTANMTAATDNVGSVTGALASGARTDDTSLVLSGTCETNSTVNVYNGTNLLGAATVTSNTWSYSATVNNATTYQFNVVETDVNGNASAPSSNFTITGDTSAPSVDTYFLSGTTGITTINGVNFSSNSFILAGTRESGASVEVWKDGTLISTVTSDISTSWTYNVTGLSEGNYAFRVKMTDAAGNTSALSSTSFNVSVDTTPPAAPSIDLVQDSNQQTLTTGVRIGSMSQWNPMNLVLLSGTCEADALIKIYNGTTYLGERQATGTTWQKDVMLNTEGAYDLNVKAFDAIGNGSAASSSFVINFDVTPPTLDVPNSPIIDATSFDPAGNIVLTFSEGIQISPDGGSVRIFGGSSGEISILLNDPEVSIVGNTLTINPTAPLENNTSYNLLFSGSLGNPIQDLAGNAVQNPINFSFTTGVLVLPEARVFFDLTTGTDFTDQAVGFGREFQDGYSYTIYVKVDSDISTLSQLTNVAGPWTGANNLGNDDKIVLVGNDVVGVRLNTTIVSRVGSSAGFWAWKVGTGAQRYAAKINNTGVFTRRVSDGNLNYQPSYVDLWTGAWAGYIDVTAMGSPRALTAIYQAQLPTGIVNPAVTAFI